MRKIVLALLISIIFTGVSYAGDKTKYGAAGCGLGSMIVGNEPGMVQLLAATTNGVSGNQTFGITFGTSNCESSTKVAQNNRLNEFMVSSLDNVAVDIAKGKGESLETLAELMNIPTEGRAMFYTKLQSNFSKIFTSEKIVAAQVIDNILTVINS